MSERLVTFDELVKSGTMTLGDGYRTKKAEHGRPGIPILRVAEVRDGAIKPDFSDYVSEDYRSVMGCKVSRPGDVVLTTKGTVGRVAIVPVNSPEFVYSPQVCFFRISAEVELDRRYLYYWFKSDAFWSQALSRKSQTDMADYLNLSDIRSLTINLPSVTTQRIIATVLGVLDDKIAVNERICETSVALAISRFEEALKDSISTPVTTLGELAVARHLEISDGYRTKKSEHGCPGVPILRVSEVSGFRIAPSFGDFVSDKFRRQMGNKISRPGDVILTTKGTVGRAAMMPRGGQEFVYSPQICFFRAAQSSPISAELLFLWMHSQEFWRQADFLKGQTDMADYLSLRDIRSMKITVPGAELHRRIHSVASLLLMQAEARQQESDTLAALRDTLLPQLMSGKLRVRDAEWIVEDAL